MTYSFPTVRNEVPSRAELWSVVLGAILASALLASAFRLTLSVRSPLTEEERSVTAASSDQPVVVRPEPHAPPSPPKKLPVAAEAASR